MRILLIRHGRSAHLPSSRKLFDRAGIEEWYAEYDKAAILPHDEPPAELISAVQETRLVAASDLPRAIASAHRLAPDRPVVELPLFREIPLPIPAVRALRAPLAVWGTLIHTKWLLDIMRGRDVTPDAFERVRRAAHWCRASGREYADDTIAIVTHGVFRRLLAKRLLYEGWRFEPGRRSYAHWSVWKVVSARDTRPQPRQVSARARTRNS